MELYLSMQCMSLKSCENYKHVPERLAVVCKELWGL
jgi:hypothetical protein